MISKLDIELLEEYTSSTHHLPEAVMKVSQKINEIIEVLNKCEQYIKERPNIEF